MKNLVALLLLSLLYLHGTTSLAEDINSDAETLPAFCTSYKCPRYQLIKKYEKFEHRIYNATNWVTTSLKLDFLGIGLAKSFKRLLDYINGKNSEGLVMKMTVPVRIKVPRSDILSTNATMSFFVPPAVDTLPTPLNPDIYVEQLPEISVYVRSFGGYALNSDYEKQAKILVEELEALELSYNSSYGTAAGYNDPLTFFNRHNEVWYMAL
ncbi:hypothetical protein XENTR_v10013573 [Xenopus tropicalis]|uniref:Heme-binding protein 1 n=1 Tax=Xenopus tropicalis TaxID=8364 RepID=A9JSE2_XENTR|nr:uncharacterized protein LOC100135146 precursor [Xenopus tropicalis]AAI56023.1 LOC100135146 protein [Xenopus tropicalis]AAI71246.1 hypothetical protein LOC100135146 [Xenopus tropicalis]AAI71248.1 hypothetical protein LOC100135146 [Xenopus tropicalis]KAE8601187.1 hypothetical protein XENTR_v10013573 [Xenopus tropicalis]|eukprot:NP_001107331.1 uncharacterized protein LOC100135146 precursor [Xenopus tropicalis]